MPDLDEAALVDLTTRAMRAFEPHSSVLRRREAEGWHTCDVLGMRAAVKAIHERIDARAAAALKALRLVAEHGSVMARLEPDAHDALMAAIKFADDAPAGPSITIESLVDLTRGCQHDGGFDREIGPIGCNLGDGCVCVGMVMGARDIVAQGGVNRPETLAPPKSCAPA